MTTWIDFEGRSAADLPKVGSYMYSLHPSSEPICLGWSFDDEEEWEVHQWNPAFPNAGIPERGRDDLENLFDRIVMGDLIEAHNAFFERCYWQNVMASRYGWPTVRVDQWRCSAAVAASFGLPRNLEKACKALRLPVQKDMAGKNVMLKCSRPRKPRVAELKEAGWPNDPEGFFRAQGYLWAEKPEDLQTTFDYNRDDVAAERGLATYLRDLPPDELVTWKLDQVMNDRGVYCDRPLAEKCLALAAEEKVDADREIWMRTQGAVTGATRREDLLEWAQAQGVDLENTQAGTFDLMLDEGDYLGDLPPDVARVFAIWRSVNRASVKKYDAMLKRIGPDERIRDILRYHGATTGRWAGAGIQVQNFPRGNVEDMEGACADILAYDRATLQALYGDVMELISGALRGAIRAAPGNDLIAADYSAIEARGTFWISGQDDALEIFRRGECIYKDMAGDIFRVKDPQNAIGKKSDERQIGKVVVLGCGYQMGGPKLTVYARDVFRIEMSEDRGKELVGTYRTRFHKVKAFWYDVERAACRAVQRRDGAEPVEVGRVAFAVRGRFLHCKLPSGRLLSYCDPWLENTETPWGEPTVKLRFMGVNPKTKQWCRMSTYGGKLTENIVQALCRDLMRDAMIRAEALGYPNVMTIHDEVVAEIPKGFGSVEDYERILSVVPDWADGFPVAAEGWRGERYRK